MSEKRSSRGSTPQRFSMVAAAVVLYALLMPPYLPPERGHFLGAYRLASGGGEIPRVVVEDLRTFDPQPRLSWIEGFNHARHWNRKKLAEPWRGDEASSAWPGWLEAPAAAACAAGKVFGSRTIVVFYLARLLGAGVVAGALWAAVRMTRLRPVRRGMCTAAAAIGPVVALCLGMALPAAIGLLMAGLLGGWRERCRRGSEG